MGFCCDIFGRVSFVSTLHFARHRLRPQCLYHAFREAAQLQDSHTPDDLRREVVEHAMSVLTGAKYGSFHTEAIAQEARQRAMNGITFESRHVIKT